MVELLAGFVIPEEDICKMVINPETKKPVSPVTLRKHFREELDTGFAKLRVAHARALFKNVQDGNVTAQIWWDKTRNRLSERIGLEMPALTTGEEDQGEKKTQLEIARRIAFTLHMGAEILKKKATPPPPPAA